MNNTYKIALKINKRYYFAELIKKLVLIEKDDYQKKLLIQYLLHYNCTHVMGRYSDSMLENEIIKLGRKYVNFKPTEEVCPNTVLFVMTKVASIGGHTSLVNNWIQFDSNHIYSIILTDCTYDDVPDFLKESVKQSGGQIIILYGKNEYTKAERLLNISQRFERVILCSHMYDIIPVLAYSNKNFDTPVYFYNHANFLFSIGLSVSDCFLTLCYYDTIKAVKYRGAVNVHTLPYPTMTIEMDNKLRQKPREDVREKIAQKYNLNNLRYLVVSMGDDFKYKKICNYDFQQFVIDFVKEAPEGTYFLIIGADSNSKRWQDMKRKTKGHAIALGRLERKQVSRILYSADMYVISFPMEGAGAYEASNYNVPVYGLNITNRTKNIYNKQIMFSSIAEMKKVMLDVVKKNKNISKMPHLYDTRYHFCNPNWINDMNKVFGQKIIHKVHKFKDKKIISKEEIINYQLLKNTNMYPFYDSKLLRTRYKFLITLLLCFLGDYYGKKE